LGLSLANLRRRRRRSVPVLIDCQAAANYSLWLAFADGLEGWVYLGDLVDIVDFRAWRDVDRFLQVAIDPDTGVVQWGDEIRLDPAALYRDLESRVRAALQ
jgi:hypothetical protein